MAKKVFIIGNGFDLNLGWNTSYCDFVKSNFWPVRKHPNSPMAQYLENCVNVNRWYDLERILREYASDARLTRINHSRSDELFFQDLRNSLTQYIIQEENRNIDTKSLAIRVLRAVLSNGCFSSIYSFNYTDLHSIAVRAGIHAHFDYRHVHGSVANKSIIIGVDDHTELHDGYAYLRKVFSEYYQSNPIRYDLQDCNEVVFFGHSLGDMDYPYFKDFFSAQSHCANRNHGKSITFFTKDNQTRLQLLEQLRIMNGGHMEHLRNDNVFKIILTESPDLDTLDAFLKHLDHDRFHGQNITFHGL